MTAVAVVAGGGERIGPAVARRLAAVGFDIVLLDAGLPAPEETVRRIEESGRRCLTERAELTDVGSVDAALGRVRSALSGPVVLVLCISPDPVPSGLPEDESEDERRYNALEGTLRPAFACGQAAATHLMRHRWGRIVIVVEPAGPGDKTWSSSQPVLAGLTGFTRSAALELARLGITVNLVAPAGPAADLADAYPDGVAELTQFLAGDRAAGITGQEIYVGAAPSPLERQVR